jgi:hypothetical protein
MAVNDAQAAAWAEFCTLPGGDDMVFTVSTGVGGGVVSNGKLQTGSGGLAGHSGTRWPILTGRFAAAGAEAASKLSRPGAVLPLRHRGAGRAGCKSDIRAGRAGRSQARTGCALCTRWRGSLPMLKLSPTAGMLWWAAALVLHGVSGAGCGVSVARAGDLSGRAGAAHIVMMPGYWVRRY